MIRARYVPIEVFIMILFPLSRVIRIYRWEKSKREKFFSFFLNSFSSPEKEFFNPSFTVPKGK